MRLASCLSMLVLTAVALGACSGESTGPGTEITDLRADLNRTKRDNDELKEKVALLERRLGSLTGDLGRSRRATAEEAPAVAPADSGKPSDAAMAAPGTPDAASQPTVAVAAVAPALKSYFETDEGKKTFATTLKAVQDQQDQERWNRGIDNALARLTKEANLSDDQQKRMKDIMTRGAAKLRELMTAMRDGTADSTGGDIRQKFQDLRTGTETEVKTVLSSEQFDVYQKIVPQAAGMAFGGFGRRPGGGN